MEDNKTNLKVFFIKLISVVIAIIVVINLTFNLFFSERLERIDKILLLNKSAFREEMKQKIRKELNDGLQNENLLAEEDKILLYKLYLKLREEFQDLEKKQTN
tara:strand:+ start:431 stop:739 length:309 start_codon:yes stop_codon:yes gene_type:complete